MPPEVRILGLAAKLPGPPLRAADLTGIFGPGATEADTRIGVRTRHHAAPGVGPSDLARDAAGEALAEAGATVGDLALLVFATQTPDVSFPGAGCFLQAKLDAPPIGSLDVRAQSAGLLCGLELAAAFAPEPGTGDRDRPGRVLLAAGEVFSSSLEPTPAGAELGLRLGDGAVAAVIGREEEGGPRLGAVCWGADGSLAEGFWCEFPASREYPARIRPEDFAAGRHYPRLDLGVVGPAARERLVEACRRVLEEMEWRSDELAAALIDFVDPGVAREVGRGLGIADRRVLVPTEEFGHVMAAGLGIGLERHRARFALGDRVLLATAGPGLAWGAAALEF